MMGLTRKGEYAIRGIVYLAQQDPKKLLLIGEIAAAVDVPQSFLAKIFQSFTKVGLIRSSRGAGGGFALAKPATDITLLTIVEAVEGPIVPNICVGDPGVCELSSGCQVHPVWCRVQAQVKQVLSSVTLNQLT
ncbi:MAG: Rrf2 family transcriptional regulator [Desulfuromonadaceae bacterium]|jgi:Rrf2 family transcriptional regulator, iron-sulfur cluster assembly transcription factor